MAGEKIEGAGDCDKGRSPERLSSPRANWDSTSSAARQASVFNGGGSFTKCLLAIQFH